MQTIKELLESTELNKIEIVTKIYQEYLASGNVSNGVTFQEIVETLCDWECISEVKPSQEELNYVGSIDRKYRELMQQMVSVLSRKNYGQPEFYGRLYEMIFGSDLFPQSDKDRGILLFLLTNAVRGIKYYKAENVIDVSENEFDEIVQKIGEKLDKAVFMIDNRFDTKTEEASQLCLIADSLNSQKEKVVFWGIIVGEARRLERESVKRRSKN